MENFVIMEKFIVENNTFEFGCWDMFGVNILLIKGGKGALGCGYINLAAAEKFGHALAIVSGVSTGDDMLNAEIKAVSSAAAALGVTVGMSGKDALLKMC